MTRHLELMSNASDKHIQERISFFERRRYVVRQMVPEGYEQYFRDRARYVSAHTSTAIEGNPLDEQQSMLVLLFGADEDNPNEIEKANTDAAYETLAQIASDKTLRIDEGLIRAFNSMLLRGLPGRAAERRGMYRPGGSQIVDADTRAIRYNPPPPEWVPDLMKGFVESAARWREEDPPPVVAAKVHFGLISIHPFEDGNGRTARLIADLVLELSGWSVDGMLSVNSILLNQRRQYYDVLRNTQGLDFAEQMDVTPFVDFHTDALCQAVIDLEEKVVEFNIRKDRWIASTNGVFNPRQVVGFLYMLDIGPLGTSTYARLNRCSQPTALSDLAEMMAARLVEKTGAGKSTRYNVHPEFLEKTHMRANCG